MNQKRFLVAVLLFVAGAFGSANAQTAQCFGSQAPVSVGYATGTISISYQLCLSPSMYWDGTITYNNVSFDGSFSINGSMGIKLNFTNDAISSVVFSGGPLIYTISGQTYTVSFNNLSYTFNSSYQPGSPTGSLVFNGVPYPADTAYFAYLFR